MPILRDRVCRLFDSQAMIVALLTDLLLPTQVEPGLDTVWTQVYLNDTKLSKKVREVWPQTPSFVSYGLIPPNGKVEFIRTFFSVVANTHLNP